MVHNGNQVTSEQEAKVISLFRKVLTDRTLSKYHFTAMHNGKAERVDFETPEELLSFLHKVGCFA